jgi:hypothetical protein
MRECIESDDCKCGHSQERHDDKSSKWYIKCLDCKCDVFETHRHGDEYCFCQRHRDEDGSRFICY